MDLEKSGTIICSMSTQIKIKLVRPEAVPPARQTDGSAGMDLHVCLDEPLELEPGAWATVPIGIALELPLGFEAQIRARSGLAAKYGVGLANGIGTIDSDFRGEINVILINWGQMPFTLQPGMRVAQMIISRYEFTEWDITTELTPTERGDHKFGSTGLGGQVG